MLRVRRSLVLVLPAVSLLSLMTTCPVLEWMVVSTSLLALQEEVTNGPCLPVLSSVSLSVLVALIMVAALLVSRLKRFLIGWLSGLRIGMVRTDLLAVLISVCVAFLLLLVTGR